MNENYANVLGRIARLYRRMSSQTFVQNVLFPYAEKYERKLLLSYFVLMTAIINGKTKLIFVTRHVLSNLQVSEVHQMKFFCFPLNLFRLC